MNDAEDIINKDLIREKDLEENDIEDIKGKYDFEDIKSTLDEGNVPENIEFFYSGDDNEKFHINCEMLGVDCDGSKFIDFLCLPKGEEIMQENILSIHLETGNIFYDIFNTQESFYDFLLLYGDKFLRFLRFLPILAKV